MLRSDDEDSFIAVIELVLRDKRMLLTIHTSNGHFQPCSISVFFSIAKIDAHWLNMRMPNTAAEKPNRSQLHFQVK